MTGPVPTTTTRVSVDRPAEGERPVIRDEVVVEGWAWSPDGPPQLAVTVGDRHAEVRAAGWRPDVSAALGIGELRGYVAVASTAALPPGPLELVVTATAADGVPMEVRRTVEIASGDGTGPARPRPYAGQAERFRPMAGGGGTTHAEHIARYRWVAPLALDRDVLDAGCGVGFGAHLLGAAGARSVTGVDAFAAAIVEAREQAHHGLEFTLGDLRELPFDGDRFDLVVCFEAIEHVVEQERVLDQIARVLRPGGVLAISTPVPGAIALHNEHHVADVSPQELEALLLPRFANLELHWQYSAVASVVDVGPQEGRPAAPSPPLRWTSGPTAPLYVVALASDTELPELAPDGALAAGWDIGAFVTETFDLKDRVAQAEARLAAERARALRAERAYEALEHRQAQTREQLDRLRSSRSWEMTAPLRAGGRAWRSAAERRRG